MGTQAYAKIIVAIKKQYPNKTDAELLQMMMKFRQWKRSKFSEEQMITIVNHKFYEHGRRLIGAPKNNAVKPDDGVKWKDGQYIPGYIKPFTPEQRKERKAKSDVVFRALFGQVNLAALEPARRVEDALGVDINGIEREDYVLLHDPAASNSPEELEHINAYNRNVLELFGKEQKGKEALIAQGMSPKEAEQTIRDKRAAVVMEYFDSLGQVEDNLEDMIRPDLPDDKLEKNVKRICELSNALVTIDNFLSKIPQSLTLPAEYLEKLRKLADRQNEVAAALHRAYAMSSPTFEYLDSDWLMGADFQGYFEDVYEGNGVQVPDESLVDYTAAQEEEQVVLTKEEEKLFASIEGSTFDPASGFIQDAFNRVEHHTTHSMYEALHSFGFTNLKDDKQTQFGEEQLTSGLYSMNASHGPATMLPVFAMERNNRYGVFQKTEDGSYKAVAPEALFNHSLKTMTDSLTADLNVADPAGHRGSRQFREMRKEFEKITNHFEEFELGNYDSSLNTQRKVLQDLIDKANAYIATKDASLKYVADRRANAKKHNRNYNLTTRETWDEKRVAMANKLKNFADLKLQELTLVESARTTLEQYEGKKPEERMKKIAEMDAEYFQQARTKAPEKWIIDKIQNTYIGKAGQINNIPEAISSQLQRSVEAISITKLNTMIETQEDAYLALVGRMVAAEQIMQEAPGGPLRSFYSDATNKDFVELGRNAMKNAKVKDDFRFDNEALDEMFGGAAANKLTRGNILDLADKFDPKQIAKDLMQAQGEAALNVVDEANKVINKAPEEKGEDLQPEEQKADPSKENNGNVIAQEKILQDRVKAMVPDILGEALEEVEKEAQLEEDAHNVVDSIFNDIHEEAELPDNIEPLITEEDVKNINEALEKKGEDVLPKEQKADPSQENNGNVINAAPEEPKENSSRYENLYNGFAHGAVKYRLDVGNSNLTEPLKKEINDILKKIEHQLYRKEDFDPDFLKSGCKSLKELLKRAAPEDNKLKKFREYVDALDEELNGPQKRFESEFDLNMDSEFDLGPMLNDVLNEEFTEQDKTVLNGLLENTTPKKYRKFMTFCNDQAKITMDRLENIVNAKGEQASAADQDLKELTALLKNVLAADGDMKAGYTAMFRLANSAAGAKTPAYKAFGNLLKQELEMYAFPNKSVFISEKHTMNFKDKRKALLKEWYDVRCEINSVDNQEHMKPIRMVSGHSLHDHLSSCLNKQNNFLKNENLFPNQKNVTQWRTLLNDTQKWLAVAESHGFFLPQLRTSLAAQTDYLDAAMGIAPWKDIPLKLAAPEQKKPTKFTDTTQETAKFYEKSNWLLGLQVAEQNSVTEAIDNKLSELLAQNMNTRAYEVCNKKRDNGKNAVKGSGTMKNLAMYATMKALLLNEQCEPHLEDRKGQFTEMLSELCEKKKFSAKELDQVLDKVLNPMFKENEAFTTAFNALNNRGMYNFIVNAEYKSLAPKVASGVYENIYKMRTAKQKDKTKSSRKPITEKKKSPVRPG